jgi:pyrroline-5-carboxylate reductase
MPKPNRNVIVGAGHMGPAIIRGLRRSQPESELFIVERSETRRTWLQSEFGLASTADLEVAGGDAIVLAIPPQVFWRLQNGEVDQGVI